MNFWETFTNLCSKNGESATAVIESLGLSKGNAQRWKTAASPHWQPQSKSRNILAAKWMTWFRLANSIIPPHPSHASDYQRKKEVNSMGDFYWAVLMGLAFVGTWFILSTILLH